MLFQSRYQPWTYFATSGPSKTRAAIITTAARARMITYSTKPWPLWCLRNPLCLSWLFFKRKKPAQTKQRNAGASMPIGINKNFQCQNQSGNIVLSFHSGSLGGRGKLDGLTRSWCKSWRRWRIYALTVATKTTIKIKTTTISTISGIFTSYQWTKLLSHALAIHCQTVAQVNTAEIMITNKIIIRFFPGSCLPFTGLHLGKPIFIRASWNKLYHIHYKIAKTIS